jgi:hypothetical protein
MIPAWLHIVAILSILIALTCALIIAWDEFRHPQRMWIMAIVWPVTALFGSVITVWGYFKYGRPANDEKGDGGIKTPFRVAVAKGTSHCGAGCCIGDLLAEWLAFFIPAVAVWFGWKTLFAEKMFSVWVLDYIFAFVLGIAFQYFTIKPMRDLSPAQGLAQALKADALSLTAWQIGMYGFMALAQFYIFRHVLGVPLEINSVEFWFMMQIAMIAGFATSYPVNWWLITTGVKEKM